MGNSIKEIINEDCCGCTACFSACPKNAIKMSENEKGFLYPVVDDELCIECGKCINVCQLANPNNCPETKDFYAVKHSDTKIREKSSSGGIFSLLADYVESKNGVIYGVEFDENFKVKHARAEKKSEWRKFTCSKYVQSALNDVFKSIKQDLKNDRYVLFSGTPCQVYGLNLFLGNKNYERLLTCDIICHGVPSPKIWNEYMSCIEKRTKKKIANVNFRNKENVGWHRSTLRISDADSCDLVNESQSVNFFHFMFLKHYILRPSCFNCKFSNINRPGDVTIGDFWGIEKNYAFFDDNKGTSLVLLNSEKGKKVFDEIKSSTEYIEVEESKCRLQQNLNYPSKKANDYDKFWNKYNKIGLEKMEKYFRILKWHYVLRIKAKFTSVSKRIKNKFCKS